jgi:hypothetical protein
MPDVIASSNGIYSEQKTVCVWNKTNGGMDPFYRLKHELCSRTGSRRTSTT